MDFTFNAEEWSTLPVAERTRRCQQLAAEAQKMADNSQGLMQQAYLEIALEWLKLADAIKRSVS